MVNYEEFEKRYGKDLNKIIQLILYTDRFFYIFVFLLILVIAFGLYAYYTQLKYGLAVTGMNDVVIWGLYISNFVFFIGISHAGTFISAILRIVGAKWRRPITRIAETITPISLLIAISMIIADLGRPDRLFNILLYGRIESPVLWDFLSISAYLIGSSIFLYAALIPDIAFLKNRLPNTSKWKKKLYDILSLNWTGNEQQRRRLEHVLKIMSIIIVPVMVTVHTVVSWVFAVQLRVGWHNPVFGPYFVVGAVYSGIATVIIIIGILRRLFGLEQFIKKKHFDYLALLMLSIGLTYIYFMINDYFIPFYGGRIEEMKLLTELAMGRYSPLFWFTMTIGFIIPTFVIAIPKTRTIKGIVVSAFLVNLAMWLKRYLIVVPSLASPTMPYEWGIYIPTWVEFSIVAASFAAFTLFYMLFFKFFPIISLWEVFEAENTKKA